MKVKYRVILGVGSFLNFMATLIHSIYHAQDPEYMNNEAYILFVVAWSILPVMVVTVIEITSEDKLSRKII